MQVNVRNVISFKICFFFFSEKKNKKEKERERQERELGGIFWISDEWLEKKKLYSTHSMIYFDSTVLFHGR